MRLPVSFVGLGPGALDLVTVRGRSRISSAQVLLADEPELLSAWAPQAERIDAKPLSVIETAARLRAAYEADQAAVRAISGSVGDSMRALDEIRILLESNVPLEVVPTSAHDVLRWPWQERLPLWSKRIAVTRPRVGDDVLAELLRRLGAEVLEAPTQELLPPQDEGALDRAIDGLHRYSILVLTSAAGVHRFIDRLIERGKDARWCDGLKLAVVGAGTAQALKEHGLVADVVPTSARGEALAEALRDQLRPGTRVLIARAAEAREVLPLELTRAGAVVDLVATHRAEPVSEAMLLPLKARLEAGEVHAVTFASASAARHLVAALGGATPLEKTMVACLGPVTAQGCEELGLKVGLVSPGTRFTDLAEALCKHFATPEAR
jgi:uroporphyrinogen-III synthase